MNRIISIFIFLFMSSRLAYATHAMGAELTYRHLGNSKYEITYTFYRDCSGIPAPATVDITIANQIGVVNSVSISPTLLSPYAIQTTCNSVPSSCNGGTNLGAQKWIYIDTITLANDLFTIYHGENARSTALTTTYSTGSNDLFVYAVINNTTGSQNSSPVFEENPVISLCQNSLYCIPSFVTDADGDSLYFEFTSPRYGPLPSDTIIYMTGYSSTQPFISNPPMTINNSTGEVCVNSTGSDVSTLVVLVSEYRNGILLGQVERDMIISMQACSNNLPTLSGFNGLPSTTLNVCAGQQNCFFIKSNDQDVLNTTSISLDGLLSPATIFHTSGNRDSVFVCLTPSDADTSAQICFHAIVSDDACPTPATTYADYCLNVTPSRICNPTAYQEEISAMKYFIVYPQFSKHNIEFEFLNPDSRHTLVLCNVIGKVVGKINATDKRVSMNTPGLSKGIYVAVYMDESRRVLSSQKIVLE